MLHRVGVVLALAAVAAAAASASARTPSPAVMPGATLGLPLFEDGFEGPAGAAPDSDHWILRGNVCDQRTAYSCSRNSNAFLDGDGNLVLRAKREPHGYRGQPYSSAFLGTFQYGHGWPPPKVRESWPVPFRIEVRALMPDGAGLWPTVWSMNVGRSRSQRIHELDLAEQRMAHPTVAGCYQHTWLSGKDVRPWASRLAGVAHMGRNWHVYSAEVGFDRVVYRVDGELCGTGHGVSGRLGLLMSNWVAKPGTWGSGGAQPARTDRGPWDLLIDYVLVTV